MKLPADHLEALALICGDDQELSGIRDLAEEWLEQKYPGLTDEQRLALCRAIFEEALRDMRRDISDVVEGVLQRYGLCPPSIRAKSIAVLQSEVAGR